MASIPRHRYTALYGPTTGDRVRLADTALWITVEADRTVYGEEVTFGGGKVIRDGMGQSQRGGGVAADTVITNAVVFDVGGIIKSTPWQAFHDAPTPKCSARPPATACGSRTPNSSSKWNATSPSRQAAMAKR